MALLQISEPGMSPDPHQRGWPSASTSAPPTRWLPRCARVRRGPADEHGLPLLPSVVRYRADGAPVVGAEAPHRSPTIPHNVIASVKRLMGRGYRRCGRAVCRTEI